MHTHKHRYVPVLKHTRISCCSLNSEVVWGIERHLFPLLVSIKPTTKHYLALMQSHSTQRINNIKTACRLKTTGLLSNSQTDFYKIDWHFHLQTICCLLLNLSDSTGFHTCIQYHEKESSHLDDSQLMSFSRAVFSVVLLCKFFFYLHILLQCRRTKKYQYI